MKLPVPAKFAELAALFETYKPKDTDFEPFSETKAKLAKYAKQGVVTVLQTGLQTGVTMASGVATLTVGVGMASITLFPLGAALGPWLAAAAIASKAEGIFALHDLRTSAKAKGADKFTCTCGSCDANLTYVINRKENNVGVLAVGIFTGGLAIIVDRVNSVRKSFQKNRPKDGICKSFIDGARKGCICAIAAIVLIREEKDPFVDAVAVIFASDGALRLKSKW
jgi:hypothetical protein